MNLETFNLTQLMSQILIQHRFKIWRKCLKIIQVSLLNLSSFDTASATNMSNMFSNCENLETITFSPSFSTENVTDMSSMFSGLKSIKI